MPSPGYDFAGYASKTDVRCTDGTVIRDGCFKNMDGKQVPLVWNHQHNAVGEVLGHAEFESRPDGLYAYAYCNDTPAGQNAKELVRNGDVNAFSIWANNLKRHGNDILHGVVRELSLVLAGADREAIVDTVVAHGEESSEEAEIQFLGGYADIICHSEDDDKDDEPEDKKDKEEETMDNKVEEKKEESKTSEKTVEDVLNSMDEEQMNVLNYLVGKALKEGDKKDSDEKKDEPKEEKKEESKEIEHADESSEDESDKTVEDVLNSMNEEQRRVLNYLVSKALEQGKKSEKEEPTVKHNAFEDYGENVMNTTNDYLSHDDLDGLKKLAKQTSGSLKDAWQAAVENGDIIAHGDTPTKYGIMKTDSSYGETGGADDYLFPDARMINPQPDFISRNMDWVNTVLNGVHRTPFARVKSIHADITEDEARARGYMKGKYKKEEVFGLLKRVTYPTVVYKKQRMDKQDIDQITEFDVLVWLKAEMQIMLREEVARAILIGDGREETSEDHISTESIRPIATDADLYTIKYAIEVKAGATAEDKAKALIDAQLLARENYKGSGSPTFFTTYKELTNCLMLENGIGEKMYKSEAEVATVMRVAGVEVVEPMTGFQIEVDGVKYDVAGIDVNLGDYNVGTNGGAKTDFFDDFDLNYNQQILLYETQLSGAMTKPLGAIVFYYKTAA